MDYVEVPLEDERLPRHVICRATSEARSAEVGGGCKGAVQWGSALRDARTGQRLVLVVEGPTGGSQVAQVREARSNLDPGAGERAVWGGQAGSFRFPSVVACRKDAARMRFRRWFRRWR